MDININDIAYEYQNLKIFFCSNQCQERFITNPHLYIGHSGIAAAKQRGDHIIKKRIIKLDQPVPDEIAELITTGLCDMMGIKEINIDGENISISYDLLEVTAKQIETKIGLMGEYIKDNWVEHLKLAFVHYIEETEIDNLVQDTYSPHGHRH